MPHHYSLKILSHVCCLILFPCALTALAFSWIKMYPEDHDWAWLQNQTVIFWIHSLVLGVTPVAGVNLLDMHQPDQPYVAGYPILGSIFFSFVSLFVTLIPYMTVGKYPSWPFFNYTLGSMIWILNCCVQIWFSKSLDRKYFKNSLAFPVIIVIGAFSNIICVLIFIVSAGQGSSALLQIGTGAYLGVILVSIRIFFPHLIFGIITLPHVNGDMLRPIVAYFFEFTAEFWIQIALPGVSNPFVLTLLILAEVFSLIMSALWLFRSFQKWSSRHSDIPMIAIVFSPPNSVPSEDSLNGVSQIVVRARNAAGNESTHKPSDRSDDILSYDQWLEKKSTEWFIRLWAHLCASLSFMATITYLRYSPNRIYFSMKIGEDTWNRLMIYSSFLLFTIFSASMGLLLGASWSTPHYRLKVNPWKSGSKLFENLKVYQFFFFFTLLGNLLVANIFIRQWNTVYEFVQF